MALSLALPSRRHSRSSFLDRQTPGRIVGEVAIGAAVLAVTGFAVYFLKERAQEEAAHDVLEREDALSLRRYHPHTVAEVKRFGALAEAMDEGFSPLFHYIAAKREARRAGESRKKIAMTVPVTVAPSDQAGSWAVRFAMPRSQTRATLPEPANGVALRAVPERKLAAIRFAGRGTDRELLARKRRELLDWVARRGWTTHGEPEFAAYNAPVVPGRLRRNEWLVEVD